MECMVNMVGRGHAHISNATEIGRSAQADGLQQPAVDMFLTCGNSGKQEHNAERDLHRWCAGLYGVDLQPYEIHLMLEAMAPSGFDLPFCHLPFFALKFNFTHCPFGPTGGGL